MTLPLPTGAGAPARRLVQVLAFQSDRRPNQ